MGRLDGARPCAATPVGKGGAERASGRNVGQVRANCAAPTRASLLRPGLGLYRRTGHTAMLAQQPRRPLTPVHSAAEPPEVRKVIAPVISPSGAYPISRFARRFGALP